MSRAVAFAVFLLLSVPQLAFAQTAFSPMPGTNGKYSCGVNDKGKKVVYLHRSTNQFVTNKRKFSRKAALDDMRQIRRSQNRVIRETVKLNRILREKSEGHSPTLPVSQFLNKKQRKILDRILTDAPVTEHLLSNSATVDSSVEAVLENFVEIVSNQQKVHTDHFASRKILKDCKGCEEGDEDTRMSSVRRKKKKRRKCSCFTKTVSASMEFYQGNEPGAPRNCQAFGLAVWSATETKNAVSVEVFYTWTGSGASLRSKSGEPPYDDVHPFYNTEIVAGEGEHQLLITHASKSHGNPDISVDCSEISANQKQLVTSPYVEARICPLGKED